VKARPIAIAVVALVVVVAVAAFALPRLFGSAAPPIESVGERVEFGTWCDEPITWRVLAIEDGRALVISEDILCVRQYDDFGVSSEDQIAWDTAATTWAESDIRAWLNGEFLETAFTEKEQGAIDLSLVLNSDNPDYGTEGGVDTEDKVFLLSIDEANSRFSGDGDRSANITMTEEDIQYMVRKAIDYEGIDITTDSIDEDALLGHKVYPWWLRSPGNFASYAGYVSTNGNVNGAFGETADDGTSANEIFGIRPALWLNL
jgi:hypothetical protein